MGAFQRQIGDMVELTPEGEKEIHKYKNNYIFISLSYINK